MKPFILRKHSQIRKRVNNMVSRRALFVINHSAGKDSQAMYLLLREIVPFDQLVIIHATLGAIEWEGCPEHIAATTRGEEFYVVRNKNKTFIEMVERRGMFPSASNRQCTSDLKRDPINSQILAICKQRDISLVVNCMGMRSQESTKRAGLKTMKVNTRISKAGREVYDLLPIHDVKINTIWTTIGDAGQVPHWAYGEGMTRLSCSFCIMSSNGDQCTAARLRPDLYQRLAKLEVQLNHTMSMSRKPLTEITGIAIVNS